MTIGGSITISPIGHPAPVSAGGEADWAHPQLGETWHGTVTAAHRGKAAVRWHSYTPKDGGKRKPMRHATTVPARQLTPGKRRVTIRRAPAGHKTNATGGGGMPAGTQVKAFTEDLHPRGHDGKFLEVGHDVTLPGGLHGRVAGMAGGGKILVDAADGTHRVIPASELTSNGPAQHGFHPMHAPVGGHAPAGHAGMPGTVSGDVVHFHDSLGVDRADMPQLSGTVHGQYVPPSVLVPKFIDRMRARGVPVTRERVPAASLKPTQATGDVKTIRSIADSIKGGADTKPVIISADNRVLDGHHTWAAHMLAGEEGAGKPAGGGMNVIRVGLPITHLSSEVSDFGAAQGIARRKPGEMADPAHASPAAVPAGRFGVPDSLAAHTLPDGSLDPARKALHDQIIKDALAGHQSQAHPVVTFMGGGPASGKSHMPGLTADDSVHVDPDQVKLRLPEYAEKGPEGAAYTHEESSLVAKQIEKQAIASRYNLTLDGVGNSTFENMSRRVQAAKAGGYTVRARYITITTDEALKRNQTRLAEIGRWVPPEVIKIKYARVSQVFPRLIAAGLPDEAELWNNNVPKGSPPKVIGRKAAGGQWHVEDPAAWERFLADAAGAPPGSGST